MKDVPYITISLSKEDTKLLEELCKKERRGKSNMISVLINNYTKQA